MLFVFFTNSSYELRKYLYIENFFAVHKEAAQWFFLVDEQETEKYKDPCYSISFKNYCTLLPSDLQ